MAKPRYKNHLDLYPLTLPTRIGLCGITISHNPPNGLKAVATNYPQVGNGIDFVEMSPEDRLRLSLRRIMVKTDHDEYDRLASEICSTVEELEHQREKKSA